MINYEKQTDNFKKTKSIESILLYGNPKKIPSPLFTILIPTYKRTELLKEALHSAIKQWHVSFYWNIIVLDNEEYSGKPNENEQMIKELDNGRVLYYRNTKHLDPGDNFNRGFKLSSAEWIMMLHDDDILIDNALDKMNKHINHLYSKGCKKIGAICTSSYQFKYDPNNPQLHLPELNYIKNRILSEPEYYTIRRITHHNVLFDTHIGGSVPTNGATFNRLAVINTGGFNVDYGISSDLILLYNLEIRYSVFYAHSIFGFYRWGTNTMVKKESTIETIQCGYDFREYIYSKNFFNKIWGLMFRLSQHRFYCTFVTEQNKKITGVYTPLSDFDYICSTDANKHMYALYISFVRPMYERLKQNQIKKLRRRHNVIIRN